MKALRIATAVLTSGMCLLAVSCNNKHTHTPDPRPEATAKEIAVDVDDYKNYNTWTYVNLKTGETKTLRDFSQWNYFKMVEKEDGTYETVPDGTEAAQGSESDIGMEWHIAFHRYDVRTNGGGALVTDFRQVSDIKDIPTTGYTEDETWKDKIITDPKDMSKGRVGYAAEAKVNAVLFGWIVKKPTGSMPPYAYSVAEKNVFILKCKDGSTAKLKFKDCFDKTGEKKVITFEYVFVEKK